jgi:hypothetical protein
MMSSKVKLKLPFFDAWFVLNGGDTKSVNHHYGNKAQKYAFDFTKLKGSKSFNGSGQYNEDYFCFSEPVLSPADGIVIEAVDGVKDNKPGNGNYLAGAGNYLIIKHAKQAYSFIAHLKLGSVRVNAGDKVSSSEQIGLCGNSGTSFAPHLHYHLQNSDVLVTYQCEYDKNDKTKGNFPKKIDLEEWARGIKVDFSNVKANGKQLQSYRPERGDLVSNQTS